MGTWDELDTNVNVIVDTSQLDGLIDLLGDNPVFKPGETWYFIIDVGDKGYEYYGYDLDYYIKKFDLNTQDCQLHKNLIIGLCIDKDCKEKNKLICQKCIFREHKKHDIVEIEDQNDKFRENVKRRQEGWLSGESKRINRQGRR